MNNQCKLSFVVPIYNGDVFLARCLESLCNQDISKSDYEILAINDCSTDCSKDLILEYCKKNPNIIYIEHDKNLNLGTTCNDGLANAKGDYVWFIGQDDYIKKNSLRILLEICENNSLDVLTFNYMRVDDYENIVQAPKVFDDSSVLSGLDFIHRYFNLFFINYLLGYEWRAIYKNEFLKKNNIIFPEGVFFEDTTFLFKSLIFSDKVQSIADFIYFYRINSNSISAMLDIKQKGNLIYEFAFITGTEVYDLSENLKNIDLEISHILRKKAIWYYESFIRRVILSPLKEKIRFYSLLKLNRDIIKSKIALTSLLTRFLATPYSGLFCAVVLKPVYLFKRNFLKN